MKPMHIDARPLAAAAFDGLALALFELRCLGSLAIFCLPGPQCIRFSKLSFALAPLPFGFRGGGTSSLDLESCFLPSPFLGGELRLEPLCFEGLRLLGAASQFFAVREFFGGALDQDSRPCIELARRAEASDSVVFKREFRLPLAGVQSGQRAACYWLNSTR